MDGPVITMVTEKYHFKKGEIYDLDEIYYAVPGVAGNDWWKHINDDIDGAIIILKTINIEIKYEILE